MSVCHTKPRFVFIYLFRVCVCVCSVLPGSENWSRLHFQHQGVFKRMLVLESGGKLLCMCIYVGMAWSFSLIISFLCSSQRRLELTLAGVVVCLPCWHMLSSHVHAVSHSPLTRQEGSWCPLWLVPQFSNGHKLVFSSVYFPINSLSISCCSVSLMLACCCRLKTPLPTPHHLKDVLILERDKSLADVGSFLCRCTGLFASATLDSHFSSSFYK